MEQDTKEDTVTVTAPEEEVVQLPPNPDMLTARMNEQWRRGRQTI